MSSEESEDDNVLKVKPIPWLSSKVQHFKKILDEEREKNLNSQSKWQTKRKLTGETSKRIRPCMHMEVGGFLKNRKQHS